MEQAGNVYIFEVVTSLAYVPVAITECQAHDRVGQNYDLSPLVRPGSYWRVATANANNRYLINVCHSVGNVNTTSCSGECDYRTLFYSALVGMRGVDEHGRESLGLFCTQGTTRTKPNLHVQLPFLGETRVS